MDNARLIIELENIVPYLLKNNLIHKKSVVEDRVTIKDVSRMNKNIQVIQGSENSYIVKQPQLSNSYDNEFVNREAKFYNVIQNKTNLLTNKIMPQFIKYDKKNAILLLEFIHNAESFATYYESVKNNKKQILLALADLIALYHNEFSDYIDDSLFSFLPDTLPITLFIVRPRPEIMTVISPGNYQLLRAMQQETEIYPYIQDIPNFWNKSTIIHGDMKLDNVLLKNTQDTDDYILRVIDWELVLKGDPLWDVACIISNIIERDLHHRIYESDRDSLTYDSLIEETGITTRLFCKEYKKNIKETLVSSNFCSKLSKLCIAKLIHMAYESAYQSDEITIDAKNIVQYCDYLVKDDGRKIKKMLED